MAEETSSVALKTDGRKKRWHRHKVERRNELVDGTLEAIRRRGSNVSMDEIAAEIGVSKTVLYRYFVDKNDLTTEVKVDVWTAMLGGQVTVPLVAGSVKMTIPAGTSSGRKFRISGKGMPGKDKPGDLYARILVTVPETLTSEQRLLIENLRASFPSS